MRISIILVLLLCVSSAWATVSPSWIFSDGVVLQRDVDVPVYGKADVGERVTVAFLGQTVGATTGSDGKWSVKLKPMPAGGPYTMTISGTNVVTVHDVLVGEVWVFSGQSNMSFPLGASVGGPEAVKSSDDGQLHLLQVPDGASNTPLDTVSASWTVSSPVSSSGFSALGYYMGRQLRSALGVPVGLIDSAIPGTHIFHWTPKAEIAANPALKSYVGAGDGLFNSNIAPLQPFAIRGVAWYQGEWQAENRCPEAEYRELLKALISGWRRTWGIKDLPFIIVQLPGFAPGKGYWCQTRNAQLAVTNTVPNTGLVVTADVNLPEVNNIHPPTKQPVGQRMALLAEQQIYHKRVEGHSPVMKSMGIDGGKAVLTFLNASGGLQVKGDSITGFEIAGADKVFHPAVAAVRKNKVEVSSPDVSAPVAVRYNYVEVPLINLFNKAGFPMSPFRTDEW